MNERKYIYDEEERTMVFSVDTKRHVRAVHSDGEVWYAVCDIAKLLRYRAPGKVTNHMDCEVRILRVPHTSENVRGFTNCNCIRQDDVKRFIRTQRTDPEICDWILREVIPAAEQKLSTVKVKTETASETKQTAEIPQVASMLDALDQFIIAAVSLRREFQSR